MRRSAHLGLALWIACCSPAAAEPARIFGAGILAAPVKEALTAAGVAAGDVANPVFGPAGVIRERIAQGEPADLFLSADLAQPRRLGAADRLVVPFARNRLCVVAKQTLGLDATNLINRLSSPQVRLATSTPVLDAAGDFTEEFFARVDAERAGAGGTLRAKALRLIGTPGAMNPVAGRTISETVFLSDKADALIYYCSGQTETLRNVPGLTLIELPPALSVPIVLGMTVLSDHPAAMRIALFLLSEAGQTMLAQHGFQPLAPLAER